MVHWITDWTNNLKHMLSKLKIHGKRKFAIILLYVQNTFFDVVRVSNATAIQTTIHRIYFVEQVIYIKRAFLTKDKLIIIKQYANFRYRQWTFEVRAASQWYQLIVLGYQSVIQKYNRLFQLKTWFVMLIVGNRRILCDLKYKLKLKSQSLTIQFKF